MDVLLQAVNCAELLCVFAGRSGFGTAKPGRTVDIEVSSQEYVRAMPADGVQLIVQILKKRDVVS